MMILLLHKWQQKRCSGRQCHLQSTHNEKYFNLRNCLEQNRMIIVMSFFLIKESHIKQCFISNKEKFFKYVCTYIKKIIKFKMNNLNIKTIIFLACLERIVFYSLGRLSR